MSGLKQLRTRVKSIKSTQKITKAMQMVSAAKLARVKYQISDSDSYLRTLYNIMLDVVADNNINNLSEEEKQYFVTTSADKVHLLIAITSERGLCGGFNLSVIRQIKIDIERLEQEGKEIKLIIVGKKGFDVLKNYYSKYIDSYFNLASHADNNILFQIKERVMTMLQNLEISSCNIYFNKFKNAITQVLEVKQMFPVQKPKDKNTSYHHSGYEYEGENLVSNLINLYMTGQINYALLQSKASEEAARMTAMDSATSNAKDIINKLTLQLNRSRQAIITEELTEIISGAESI